MTQKHQSEIMTVTSCKAQPSTGEECLRATLLHSPRIQATKKPEYMIFLKTIYFYSQVEGIAWTRVEKSRKFDSER